MRANILRAAFVGSALCLLIGAILGHQTAAGHALLCVGAIAGVTRTLRAILAYAGSPSREPVAVTLDDARTASREAARWIVARLRDEGRALRDSHVASGLVARELDVVDRLAGVNLLVVIFMVQVEKDVLAPMAL